MKRIIITATVLLTIFSSIFSQEKDYENYNGSFGIRISTGYNQFKLEEAKNLFNEVLAYYQNINIPVQYQEEYPGNILWRTEIFYFPSREISLWLGTELSNTSSYSIYKDYAGTLDIKSKIEFISINFKINKHFMNIGIIQPFVGIGVGFILGKYNLEEKAVIINTRGVNNSLEFNSSGLNIEASLGFSYDLKIFILELQTGYRIARISKPKQNELNSHVGTELDASGFNVKLGIRAGIYW